VFITVETFPSDWLGFYKKPLRGEYNMADLNMTAKGYNSTVLHANSERHGITHSLIIKLYTH